MLTAECLFPTENASRYIAQLCKHFAHKITVEFDAQRGEANFPMGHAVMEAREDGLFFKASAEDADALGRVKYILEDHILRFAFREDPQPLNWSA